MQRLSQKTKKQKQNQKKNINTKSRPSLLMDEYMFDYFMASDFKIWWVGYWNEYVTQFQGLHTQALLNPKMISAWIKSSWEENNKGNCSDSLTSVQNECTIIVPVRSRQTLTMPNIPGINLCEILWTWGCEMLPLNYGPETCGPGPLHMVYWAK